MKQRAKNWDVKDAHCNRKKEVHCIVWKGVFSKVQLGQCLTEIDKVLLPSILIVHAGLLVSLQIPLVFVT